MARRLDGRGRGGGFGEGGLLLLLWWEERRGGGGGGGGNADADAEARKSRSEVQWWHSGGWRRVIPLGWSVQGGGGRGTCVFVWISYSLLCRSFQHCISLFLRDYALSPSHLHYTASSFPAPLIFCSSLNPFLVSHLPPQAMKNKNKKKK